MKGFKQRFVAILWLGFVLYQSAVEGAEQPAVTARDLFKPTRFPEASFGMRIEAVNDGPVAKVITTGAEFLIDKAAGSIECRQRIAQARPVARLNFAAGSFSGLNLAHYSSGAALFSGSGSTVRVNGDSLLMAAPGQDGPITAQLLFTPDYHSEFKGNFNFFDPTGGICFFEHGQRATAQLNAVSDPVVVTWTWKAGDVFWAGICPPKAFDWEASARHRVILSGSSVDRWMYPSDAHIYAWKNFANALYLHNEPMWEHWQLSLVPRDKANYLRVMRTAHEFGMKVVVYASPHFLTKGTSVEGRAHPDPHHGVGQFSGSNADEYVRQAKRLIKEFETDGLYFDEIYSSPESLAAQYFVTRACREVVGEEGLLYFHSTTDVLGDGHTGPLCPAINAYFNVVYKGEGEWKRMDPGYIRYVLCTYNTSNAIGAQVLDDRYVPSPEQIEFWLTKANLRFFLPAGWFYSGHVELFRRHYWPRLTSSLKTEIEPELLRRTGVFDQFRTSAGSRQSN